MANSLPRLTLALTAARVSAPQTAPSPDECHEKPISAGIRVKHVTGNHGHQRDVLKSEYREHRDDADQPDHFTPRPDVRDAFPEFLKRSDLPFRPHERRKLYRQETADHREIAQRIDAETPGEPGARDDSSGQRRSDDPSEVEPAGIERDCVDDIVTPDELDNERLPRRNLDSADEPVYSPRVPRAAGC